jgi:hypothetical protein
MADYREQQWRYFCEAEYGTNYRLCNNELLHMYGRLSVPPVRPCHTQIYPIHHQVSQQLFTYHLFSPFCQQIQAGTKTLYLPETCLQIVLQSNDCCGVQSPLGHGNKRHIKVTAPFTTTLVSCNGHNGMRFIVPEGCSHGKGVHVQVEWG